MTSLFGGGAKAVSKTPTRAMGIDLQGSQYGPPIPVVFGQNKVAGNVIWYGDFKATSHTQKQPGKGGGGSSSTSYTYSCSFELGLCEGVASVVNVYQGSSTVSLSRSGGIAFSGTTGQAAWSHLTGSAALGYSGTALAAFQNLELGSSASLPNFNFEVAARNQFGGGVVDANPADIVTAICTDAQIGVGFGAMGDLTAFKNYCTAAGIFFSPVYSTQNPAHQTLDDLFKYANAAPFFSEGVLKVVPYGDATITGNGVTYTPNTTAVVDLGRDDFITNGPGDPVTIHRISPADAMNLVRVEYKDRANTYHTNAVVASIDQDVVGTGSRADQSESVDMITQAAVARLVAQNLLQRIYYIRNAYQFQLSWRYCYLEPMDIVTLTDANTGLYLTPVRITEIGEDEHGLLSVTAEEFPEGVSHGGTYGTQPNSGATVDPNADPGPIDAPYLFRGPGFLVSNAQPEIWCALTGNSALWAGCDVYISHDGTSYSYLATTSKSAAYGHLTNTLASAADPDTTGAPNVVLNGAAQLLGGSQADADQFITLAMVDNELIAYETATLAGGPSYTLGYIRRGGYGSAIAAHAVNAPFVRLDDNILRIPVDPSQIGQTVYLKFVSFNVFGKGGRTLADETAYTYVIGTNIELPDVPVTPTSPAVTGVADGVSITWYNANPAAVGCTSIEYATASGGPWTVLAQVGPTTTAYAHHFTNGATYYYRLRSRGPVVAAGWSAYTAVLTNKGKTVADGADVTGSVTGVPVYNPKFAVDLSGWSFDTAGSGEWYREAAGNSPDASVGTYLVHKGVAGQGTTCAHNTGGGVVVTKGQSVSASIALRSIGANAGSRAYVRIGWYNSAGGEITNSTNGVNICSPDSGYFTQGVSRVYGTAPTGAVRAVLEIEFDSHTSGYYTATNGYISGQPASIDEVADSASYAKSAVMGGSAIVVPNANFLAPVDGAGNIPGWKPENGATLSYYTTSASPFTSVQCLHATLSGSSPSGFGARGPSFKADAGDVFYLKAWVYSDTGALAEVIALFASSSGSYLGQITAQATGYGAWQQVSASGVAPSGTAQAVVLALNTNTAGGSSYFYGISVSRAHSLDNEVVDGPNYARIKGTELSSGLHKLGVAGSGALLGNQLNIPNSLTLNYGAIRNTTALSASSTGAVSVSAFTYYMGAAAVNYSAVSNAVTGLTQGSTYYIYTHDAGGTGGSKTWYATTNVNTLLQTYDDIVVAGQVTIPTSGSSGGGGGGLCVCNDMLIADGRMAGDAEPGDIFDCLDLPSSGMTKFRRALEAVERSMVECVRITTDGGAVLECSASTPFDLPGGGVEWAPRMAGHDVVTDLGVEHVAMVEHIGARAVSHIHLGGCSYAAGRDARHRIYSHNQINKP